MRVGGCIYSKTSTSRELTAAFTDISNVHGSPVRSVVVLENVLDRCLQEVEEDGGGLEKLFALLDCSPPPCIAYAFEYGLAYADDTIPDSKVDSHIDKAVMKIMSSR